MEPPSDPPVESPRRTYAEELMARAHARVEFERIQRDATDGDLLNLKDIKPQFGISHLLLLTTFTAFLIFASANLGGINAFLCFFACIIAWGWFFASRRRRSHDADIERRLRKLHKNHDQNDLQTLPINAVRERERE